MKLLDFRGAGRALARPRLWSAACAAVLGFAAMQLGGCANLLGIDEFTDETGAGASGTTTTSTGGSGQGGMGTTTTTTTTTTTGVGGGGGGGPALQCQASGMPKMVFQSPQLAQRRTYDVVVHPMSDRYFIAMGTRYDSGSNSSRLHFVSRRLDDSIGPVASHPFTGEGDAEVLALRLDPAGRLFAMVRTSTRLVEITQNYNPATGDFMDTPGEATIALPPTSQCPQLRDVVLRRPLKPSPAFAIRCETTSNHRLYLNTGSGWTNFYSTPSTAQTPETQIRSYVEAGSLELLTAGDDPASGMRIFTTPFTSQPTTVRIEEPANRLTTNFSAVTEPGGKARVYGATLQAPFSAPARVFFADLGPLDFPGLSMVPAPGFQQVAELTAINEFILWDGWVSTGQLMLAGGINIAQTGVFFTATKNDGALLLQNFPVATSNGKAEAVGVAKLDGVNFMVSWLDDSNGLDPRIFTQKLVCIGGG